MIDFAMTTCETWTDLCSQHTGLDICNGSEVVNVRVSGTLYERNFERGTLLSCLSAVNRIFFIVTDVTLFCVEVIKLTD